MRKRMDSPRIILLMAAPYRACIRSRSFCNLQAVADTVHRVNDLRRSLNGNLLAQPVDVNLHKVRFTVEVRVPDMLDDLGAGCHIGRPAHEKFEERKGDPVRCLHTGASVRLC